MVRVDKKFFLYTIILLLLAISFQIYPIFNLAQSFAHINFVKIFKENYIWFILTFIQMIFVGIWEEIIFRGMLQTYLIKKLPLYVGIILQAILFSLVHLINGNFYAINAFTLYTINQMYFRFIAGLALGITYYKTRSIVYPIFLHAALDIIVAYSSFIASH
ncbi:MAG: CPBP family intramembrane metalloprotease [Oscillospiraceae bacterium]|nr:CPBP family intramembrane metalloprotease [Oscillospiraceae bacterium]